MRLQLLRYFSGKNKALHSIANLNFSTETDKACRIYHFQKRDKKISMQSQLFIKTCIIDVSNYSYNGEFLLYFDKFVLLF